MVVFYHFGKLDIGSFEYGVYHITFGQCVLCFCSVSIPLFFMINGALILGKERTANDVYAKAGKLALLNFIWSFEWMRFHGIAWFLRTLIVLYVLYPIYIYVYRNKKLKYIFMASVFIFPFFYNFMMVILKASCFYFGNELSFLDLLPSRTGAATMYSFLYFFMGAVLSGNMPGKKRIPLNIISIVLGYCLVILDVIVSSNYSNHIQDAVNACFPTIGAFLMAVGIFNLVQLIDLKPRYYLEKISDWLSPCVFPIYLFHMIVRTRIYSIFLTKEYYPTEIVLLMSLSLCFVCCILGKILKNIPVIKELIKT